MSNSPIIRTPYYLFDKKKFINILDGYSRIGDIYYPIKANDSDEIVDAIINNSCCFEVDSIEHIRLLIQEKKVSSEGVLYSYPIREEKDIEEAVSLNVKKFVVDSFDEYYKINNYLSDGMYFVRLNVVDILHADVSPCTNKWGLSILEAKNLIEQIKKNGGNVIGISFYLFDDIACVDSLKTVLHEVINNFEGYNIKYLNIGGGLNYEELEEIEDLINKAKLAIGADKAIIEPGRCLLNPCIDMIVSVIAIKTIGSNKIVFINAGIYYGLIDVIVKKRHFEIYDFDKNDNRSLQKVMICGSSSDVSDFLGEYKLRNDLKICDQLIIKGCGSYSSVMQTCFYGKKKIDIKINPPIKVNRF